MTTKRMSQTPLIVVEVVLVGVLAAIVVGQHGSGHHAKAASTAPTAPSLPTADSAPAVSTTAAAPTTTTTAPRPTTTTIDPVRDANADYLTMATAAYQVHVIAHARYAARNGRIAWINFPAYCGAIDGADITFAHRLGEHWWPPSARPSVARLVLDTAGLADLEQQCAHTSGRSRAIQTIANQIGVATTKTAADQSGVQTALGLPVTS